MSLLSLRHNISGKILQVCGARARKLCVFIFTIAMVSSAYSNPVLDNVAAGNVTVTQSPSNTVVNQASQQAIINWNSFNIAAGEKTQFVQPNTSAIALNRINPAQGASQIYGSLSSNGQIILINGAGIHFGPSAMVNVGGMIVSTSDISNANFLAGNYNFNIPSSLGGSIINEGTIIAAKHGLIALLGANVQNNGLIQAESGSIVLGAGNVFTLDFYGDQLINFSVDQPASTGGTIKNTGTLLADGGKILVTAEAAQSVIDNAIDMQGVAQAESVDQQNGEIILSSDANINVTGTLDASGLTAGELGGTIKVLGNNAHLASTANLNASGDAGGGIILVGGNSRGEGPEQDALTTTVDAGATLAANATTLGHGGKIVVWSNNDTEFHGSISATGGALGGNGGNAETSGGYLNISGTKINLSAANYNDPRNLDHTKYKF
jgi:filamentous hemagglutinin family protein